MAFAERDGAHPVWWRALLCLAVSLALQIGVNYANDYSDGVRGTDDAGVRVGPPRLVGWGLASPQAVRGAALAAFAVACGIGLVAAAVSSWWLVAIGASAVAAGWLYTGGPKPYGYLGLGELFVFVFFGLVAVGGTTFVVLERIPSRAVVAGALTGLLAVALLVTNNLRDIPGDRQVAKRTLAVRLGDGRTRVLYQGVVGLAFVLVPVVALVGGARWGALAGLGAAPLAVDPLRAVRSGASGRELIAVLGATARVQLVLGALLSAGLLLG